MKAAILIFLFIIQGEALALCVPGLDLKVSELDVKAELETVSEEFQTTAETLLPSQLKLTLKLDVLNPRINAEIVKASDVFEITVMGGMLSQPELTPDALILLLCHELGHLLGGDPKKSRGGWSSTEGQADYFSSSECVRHWRMSEDRFLYAAENLTKIYAKVGSTTPPKVDSCDEREVERTNFGYPGLQCRLDTLVSGWRLSPRPACWFKADL